jgi:hypothetical protein
MRHATRKLLGIAAPPVERVFSIRDGDVGLPEQRTDGNITELTLPSPTNSPYLVIMGQCLGAVPTLESGVAH